MKTILIILMLMLTINIGLNAQSVGSPRSSIEGWDGKTVNENGIEVYYIVGPESKSKIIYFIENDTISEIKVIFYTKDALDEFIGSLMEDGFIKSELDSDESAIVLINPLIGLTAIIMLSEEKNSVYIFIVKTEFKL